MFFRKEIKIIRIIFSEINVFCFKQHLIFGVIMIIILISFLKNHVIYTKLLFHCS